MHHYNSHRYSSTGMTVVEVLVGLSILLLVVVFLAVSLTQFFVISRTMQEKAVALHHVAAGHEYVRYLRDADWTTLSGLTLGTTYYLDVATSTITIGGTPESIDGTFSRTVVLRGVYRNSDDDIVSQTAPGATLDSDSVAVDVTVSWSEGSVSSRSLLTNFMTL